MLDEKKGVELLTCDVRELGEDIRPLKYNILAATKSLDGLNDAVVTVTRYFMFDVFKEGSRKERFEQIKDALLLWLGLYDKDVIPTEPIEGKKLKDWIKTYIIECLIRDQIHDDQIGDKMKDIIKNSMDHPDETIKRLDEFIEDNKGKVENENRINNLCRAFWRINGKRNKITYSEQDIVLENDKLNRKNTEKIITYNRAIAAAVSLGPLKTYYLAVDREPWSAIKKKTKTKTELSPIKDKKKDKNDKDLIQKIISTVLMDPTRERREGWAFINASSLANWCKKSSRIDNGDTDCYVFEGKKLFENHPLDNRKFIRVSEAFLKEFDWHIVEESELDDFRQSHKDYIIYRDCGSCRYMEKI